MCVEKLLLAEQQLYYRLFKGAWTSLFKAETEKTTHYTTQSSECTPLLNMEESVINKLAQVSFSWSLTSKTSYSTEGAKETPEAVTKQTYC